MGMVKYLVRLPNGTTEIEAETVNLGQRKLWFYDRNDDLVALFLWEKIVGFEVTGSARDQKFTDSLLQEKKTVDDQREAEIRAKGELWVTLTDTLRQLRELSSTLSKTSLNLNQARTKNETETALLVRRHEAELRQLEAQFTDQQKAVNSSIQSVLREFKELFTGGK